MPVAEHCAVSEMRVVGTRAAVFFIELGLDVLVY
jgi:hypothetical protein